MVSTTAIAASSATADIIIAYIHTENIFADRLPAVSISSHPTSARRGSIPLQTAVPLVVSGVCEASVSLPLQDAGETAEGRSSRSVGSCLRHYEALRLETAFAGSDGA